jgi:hypothetical protein
VTAFPQTPHPGTPGGAAAHGWMEDIKRVINIDSVEEFWGYVQSCDFQRALRLTLLSNQIVQ